VKSQTFSVLTFATELLLLFCFWFSNLSFPD